MTASFGVGIETLVNEILENVARGQTPFECLQKIEAQYSGNKIRLINALISLGLPGFIAMNVVATVSGLQAAFSEDEINRLLFAAIQTTDLAMSSDHESKVQEKPT